MPVRFVSHTMVPFINLPSNPSIYVYDTFMCEWVPRIILCPRPTSPTSVITDVSNYFLAN